MEGKKEGKEDTSSESEAEDSGIFTKIKEKVADALDWFTQLNSLDCATDFIV